MGDITYLKSNLSKHELIVKAISEMDIDRLEILIKDYLSEDKKKEFIDEIKSEFIKFRENNDSHLIAHDGICNGDWCDNYGSCGYSFTGNVSNTFYNLVFEEENGNCVGICECYTFKVNDDSINEARLEAEKKDFDSYGFTQEDIDGLPF